MHEIRTWIAGDHDEGVIREGVRILGADKVIEAGAVIPGGHTVRDVEIKYGLSVTGIVEPEKLITNREAKPGDALLLTKGLGTGFITTAFKAGRCPDDVLTNAVEGNDGASMVYQRFSVPAGAHRLSLRLRDTRRESGFDHTRDVDVVLAPRENLTVDFRPETGGFVVR